MVRKENSSSRDFKGVLDAGDDYTGEMAEMGQKTPLEKQRNQGRLCGWCGHPRGDRSREDRKRLHRSSKPWVNGVRTRRPTEDVGKEGPRTAGSDP